MKTAMLGAALLLCPAAGAQAQQGVVLTATSHNFVSVPEGATVRYGIHLTNQTGAPFPFVLTLTGNGNFTQRNDCPATVGAGAGCEIIFSYTAPQTSQWEEANFSVATNGAAFPNGSKGFLRAHAVTPNSITVNSQKHNFGQVTVGTPAADKFGLNISNGSTSAVPFSFEKSGDTAPYTVDSNCPATLPAAAQCSLVFTFKPTKKGWQEMHLALNTGSVTVNGGNDIVLVGAGS